MQSIKWNVVSTSLAQIQSKEMQYLYLFRQCNKINFSYNPFLRWHRLVCGNPLYCTIVEIYNNRKYLNGRVMKGELPDEVVK